MNKRMLFQINLLIPSLLPLISRLELKLCIKKYRADFADYADLFVQEVFQKIIGTNTNKLNSIILSKIILRPRAACLSISLVSLRISTQRLLLTPALIKLFIISFNKVIPELHEY